MKLTIEYNAKNGFHITDGGAEDWVDIFIAKFFEGKKDLKLTVASALLIDFFRVRLAQGVIETDQIAFTFEGKTLRHNKHGRIEHWPKGFCDIPIEPMEQLLMMGSEVHKKSNGV
jgi:hypothetical protein